MKSFSREDRLVENEVIFRDVNQNVSQFMEETGQKNKLLPFYCECANPDCRRRINLNPQKYKKLHQDKQHFVILPGHEFPEVEKIIKKNPGYHVVEKYFKTPHAKTINMALKSINETSSV